MSARRRGWTLLLRDETGAVPVEYGLIAVLVSVATIASLSALGVNLAALFAAESEAIDAVTATVD